MYTDYSYYSDMPMASTFGSMFLGFFFTIMMVLFIILLGSLVLIIISNYKIYKKAGKGGWEALIPIYNTVVSFEFLNIPMWMIVFIFIPIANLVVPIFIAINMAKKFGKGVGFIIGLILVPVVFYPILAFGSSTFDSTIPGIFDDTNEINTSEFGYCKYCGTAKSGNYCSKCGKTNE